MEHDSAGDLFSEQGMKAMKATDLRARGKVEPSLASAAVGARFQFERLGYFCADKDSTHGRPVFNRTVTLKDTWRG